MKQCMSHLYEYELQDNLQMGQDGGLTASERRVYIVNWVSSAWEALKRKPDFIRKSFVSTGWLLAKDGSENHLVKLKNGRRLTISHTRTIQSLSMKTLSNLCKSK